MFIISEFCLSHEIQLYYYKTDSSAVWYYKLCSNRSVSQSVQLFGQVPLLATPWTAACQASLSITNSWIPPKLMSIELVMPFNHLILCFSPSPPAFNLSQYQDLFKWVSSLHQVAKVLEFQLQYQSFQEGQYIRFRWRRSLVQRSAYFTRGFLLVRRSWCHHEGI